MCVCVCVCTCLEWARAYACMCVCARARARTCVCRDSLHASNKYAKRESRIHGQEFAGTLSLSRSSSSTSFRRKRSEKSLLSSFFTFSRPSRRKSNSRTTAGVSCTLNVHVSLRADFLVRAGEAGSQSERMLRGQDANPKDKMTRLRARPSGRTKIRGNKRTKAPITQKRLADPGNDRVEPVASSTRQIAI